MYYKSLPVFNKAVFLDVLNDLIKWTEAVDDLMHIWFNKITEFTKLFPRELIEGFKKDFKIWKLSWIFKYRKEDFFIPEVKEHLTFFSSSTLSNISFMRRWMIHKLIETWSLIDLEIDEALFDKKAIIEHLTTWKKRWEYKINRSALFVNDKQYGLWKKIFSWDKDNKEDIWWPLLIQLLDNFIWNYWEDEINKTLNTDDSYNKVVFYSTDKNKIINLKELLELWDGKKVIHSISFKEWNTFINSMKVKYKKNDKAYYILSLIAKYFSEYPLEDSVNKWDLQDIHIENGKPIQIDFWDSFRTWYIKSLNDRFEKKFLNGRIFEMKKDTITIKEMENF